MFLLVIVIYINSLIFVKWIKLYFITLSCFCFLMNLSHTGATTKKTAKKLKIIECV